MYIYICIIITLTYNNKNKIDSDVSSDEDNSDVISSDEDEYGHYAFDDEINSTVELLTKYKYVDDIEYYNKNFNTSSPDEILTKKLNLSQSIDAKLSQQIRMEWNQSHNFFCLGKRDGFYMRIKVHKGNIQSNSSRQKPNIAIEVEDYKLRIPWCNVSYICCEQRTNKSIKIGIKYCVVPDIQQLMQEEVKSSRKKKKSGVKQFRRKWKTISESDYPSSIIEFLKYPKIAMILTPYQYQMKQVKQAIKHHSKILDAQRISYSQFKKKVLYTFNEEEKHTQQTIYRGSRQPYLQKHTNLRGEINSLLKLMFDSRNGRVCASCDRIGDSAKNRVGWFEEHPVCIQSDDTIETCDSNIIKGIHDTKFDPFFSARRNLSSVIFIFIFL